MQDIFLVIQFCASVSLWLTGFFRVYFLANKFTSVLQ